jgi:N utilization substance protein A
LEKVKEKYSDGKQDFLDGITVEYKDWWFNVRPSNTEPVLRLTIEADDSKILEKKKKELTKLISKLFELEVPEIFAGTVEIKAIAREAGERTKLAVSSNEEGIDPIGSCVGQKGTRVQAVIDELGGEKIDIILWNDDIAKFISAALSPAKVLRVDVKETTKEAVVVVPEDQLSLAIGKRGQNVRLAAKLTGWKIDISGVSPEGDKKEKEENKEGEEMVEEKVEEDKTEEKAEEPKEEVKE